MNERPYSFSAPPKTLPLLALLVLRRAAPVPRETLAGLLWPEVDEEDARANLRRHLHYLQQALPAGDWIIADRKTVRWNPEAACIVDVAEFERQSKYPQLRAAAAELYRGDLLASVDDEALFYDRDRLRTIQLNNLTELAGEAERSRDPSAAAQRARALLAIDPWREDAVRIVMRSRMQAGDRAGALAEYERFAQRLRAELDVDPDAQTAALYDAFAHQRAPAPDTPAAAGVQLAGRASELDALQLHWRMAENAQASLVLVAGEAGAGKTRLVQTLAAEITANGGSVIAAHAAPSGQSAYESLAAALDVRPALPETTTLSLSTERGSVFAAFAEALQRRAASRPVLLWIEDVHWADADFIALLEFLERRLRGERILILATYRDDAIAPDHPLWAMRRAHSGRGTFAHVSLAPLDRAAAEQIARERLGAATERALLDEIYARSGGNALFLTELIEYAAERGSSAVPQTVRAVVEARASALSMSALELALLFAAARRTLPPGVAARFVTGEWRRALLELVRARFLREERTAGGTTYAYVHELVREALYELAAPERIVAAHMRLAEAFADAGDEFAAERAYHLERGGRAADAARDYVTAAGIALASFANESAELFAQRALELATEAAIRFDAYDALVNVYHRNADREHQLHAAEAMMRLADECGDRVLAARALYQRLSLAFFENDEPVLGAHLAAFRALIPDEPLWHARYHLFESAALLLRGAPQEAWSAGLQAMQLCERANYPYGQLFSCVWLLQFCDGYTRPYAELLETGRALERDVNDPDAAALLAGAEARIFLHVDRTVCAHAATRLLEAGERSGNRATIGMAHMYLGAIAMYRFEPDAALEHFGTAESMLAESPRRIEYARLLRFYGLFWCAVGRVQKGVESSLRGLELAREAHGHELIAICAANAIYALNLQGRYVESAALGESVQRELECVREEYFVFHHLMTTFGRALCELGEYDRGIGALEGAYHVHRARRYHLQSLLIGATAAYYLVRAGRGDEALPYLEECEAGIAAMIDEGFNTQEYLWLCARALHTLGERERAQALLDIAASLIARHSERFSAQDDREAYLQMPLNRAILAAHGDRIWPTP